MARITVDDCIRHIPNRFELTLAATNRAPQIAPGATPLVEPNITHPLAVAKILAEWHLDAQAMMAALLHDVVEDTPTTKSEIAKRFGKPVADLVDGVSKIDRIEFATLQQAQAENFRKMLLAMARDVRVILIKLADRLHNMRTLDAVEPEK